MNRDDILTALRNQTPLIAPSMLKCDFGNLHREVGLLESAGARVLHLDVMDGHFVPTLSYGPMVIEAVRRLTELPLDAHLMIDEPQRFLTDYLDVGCDCITFHYEAVTDPPALLRRIRDAGAVAGMAINPGTPVSAVESMLADCDLVLVMSVEPGFGGQSFQPAALPKLRRLRQLLPPHGLLSVDGGIGPSTIGGTVEAGADVFVVGSAVFEASDYAGAIRELKQLAEQTVSFGKSPKKP